MSVSRNKVYWLSSCRSTLVPPNSGRSTLSPGFTDSSTCLPSCNQKRKVRKMGISLTSIGCIRDAQRVDVNCMLTELRAPGPTAMTTPSNTLACAFSGMTIPPLVWVNASARCTKMRSNNGIRRLATPAWTKIYRNMKRYRQFQSDKMAEVAYVLCSRM